MNDRDLVYGLLTELVETADSSLEEEFMALLLRVASELPPQSPEEADLVYRASSFLLETAHTAQATWRAIQGLLAAAKQHHARALEPISRGIDANPNDGFLRALGFEMKSLIALSPGIAARGGLAVIRAIARTTGPTDLESFGHLFADKIPEFLDKAPLDGARLALGVVDSELDALSRRYEDGAELARGPLFRFANGEAGIDSSWWLQGTQQEPLQVIGELATALFRMPEIAPLCCRTLPASFWIALAKRCAEDPGTGIARFPELLEATPLLSVPEVAAVLARFLESSASHLKPEQVGRIQGAIDGVKDRKIAAALASLLPEGGLSDRLRELRSEYPTARADLGRRADPPEITMSAFDDKAWLRMEGAEPDSPENASFIETSRPLEQFASRYLNEAPDIDTALSIVPKIHNAMEALKGRSVGHEAVQRQLADWMTGAADAVLRCEKVPEDVSRGLWPIIAFAVEHPFPPAGTAGFSGGGWSRPAPRIVGASAIMNFGLRIGVDAQVRERIQKLAEDPVEAVRYQVYARSNVLFHVAPDLMWDLLEQWATREQETLQFLVGPLARVLRSNPARAAKLLAALWDRDDLQKAEEVRTEVAPLVGLLAEEFREPDAIRVLGLIFLEARVAPRTLERILADMRRSGVWVSNEPVVRARYVGFLRKAMARAKELLGSNSDSERTAGLGLADDAISQSVFLLEDTNGKLRVSEEQAGRFFDELGRDLSDLLGAEVEDYRAYVKAKLLCCWMQLRPEAGVIAARGFTKGSAVARRGGRSDELATVLLSIPVSGLKTMQGRHAAVELALQLAPFSIHSVALHEFAVRVARAG